MKKLFVILTVFCSIVMSNVAFSQINYNCDMQSGGSNCGPDWDNNGFSDGSSYTGGCTGMGLYDNSWNSGTSVELEAWNNVAITGYTGGSINLTFQTKLVDYYSPYQDRSATEWGSLKVFYNTTTPTVASPGTQIGSTISSASACQLHSIDFVPASMVTNLYIAFIYSWGSGDNWFIIDELSVVETVLSDFTWTGGAGDNNWNTVANWDSPSGTPASAAPTSSDNCIIASTADANITAGGACNNLTINSDATFSLQAGGPSIVVNGDLLVGGLNSSITTGSLTVNGSSTISSGAKILISNGSLNARGAFDATGATLEFAGTGTIALSDAVTSIGTITNTSAGGTIKYIGVANQTVRVPAAGAYHNLTIENASTKTAEGNLNVDGNLTTEAEASCILDLSIYDLNVAGNLTVGQEGGLDASDADCAVTFSGNSTLTHAGSTTQTASTTPNDQIIGTYAGTNYTYGTTVFRGNYEDGRNQYIVTAAELSAAGYSTGSIISGIQTYITTKGSTMPYNMNVKIGHSSLTAMNGNFTTGTPADQTTVYSGAYSTTAGAYAGPAWTSTFTWNGSDNIIVEYCYNNTAWSAVDYMYYSTESYYLCNYNYDDGLVGCSMANYSYTQYRPLFKFIGTNPTTTTTSINPTFNEIVVNGGDVTLSSAVDVTAALALTSGDIITTATNYLNAGTATITGGGNSSHVQGTLKRTLASNAQADFPVGNGTELKKVSITPADATSRVWTISQLNSAYSNLSVVAGQGLDHVSSSSYWDISPSSTSENTVVKLNWVSNPGIEDDNLDSIVLAHYNSSEAAWEEITTTSNGDPASGGISGTISSFSPFALGSKSSSNILPIDLISFSASCKDDIVDVIFSVASQQNNDYFVIERSADGKEWEEISTIKGELKSNEQKNYSISDFAPLEGLSYYKLTQVDNDGEFKTFAPISNSCYSKETNVTFLVYPVPVINKFTFEISVDDYQGSDVFYNLINMQGAVVLTDALDLNRGVNSQTIDINHLASGIYMLSVNNSKDQIPITKIIKK